MSSPFRSWNLKVGALCSSQPARDWKSYFSSFSFFSFWSSFFELKIIIPFLSPLSYFIFFNPVFPPFGIFIVFPLLRKWSWELPPGFFSRTLFVSFHLVSFPYCFGYFSFFFLEIIKKSFFSNPFRFFFVVFSFLCVLVMFPSFALKIIHCQRDIFSRILFVFVFFRFG